MGLELVGAKSVNKLSIVAILFNPSAATFSSLEEDELLGSSVSNSVDIEILLLPGVYQI